MPGSPFACKVYNMSMLKRQRSYQKQGRRMVVTDGVDKVHDEVAVMKKMTHPCTLGLYEFLDDDLKRAFETLDMAATRLLGRG